MPATGPRTSEGKAVASRNALRHGLTSTRLILDGVERPQDWEDFRSALVEDVDPADPLERALAERIAELFWRLRRVARAERDLIAEAARNDEIDGLPPRVLSGEKGLNRIIKCEANLTRELYDAMHALQAARDRRRSDHPASADGLHAPMPRRRNTKKSKRTPV